MTLLRLTFFCLLIIWLAGCASTPSKPNVDLSSIPPAVPKNEPLSKYGNPNSYTVFGQTYYPMSEAAAKDFSQTGIASWYGRKFHGERTSSGETYNMFRMTAAHKTLPLPSYVRVTNLSNGKQVIVRVNDRGPFHGDRIIDLSYVAALKLDIVDTGTARVHIETVSAANTSPTRRPAQTQAIKHATAMNTPAGTAASRHNEPVATESGLYLQVGAFAQRSNARQITRRLYRMGLVKVSTRPGRDNGQTLYHVRVGPFSSRTGRRAVRRRLSLQGIPVIPVNHNTVR